LHCRDVQSAFMCERRRADIGCVAIGRTIQNLVEQSRYRCELPQTFTADPGLELRGVWFFQHKRRDNGAKVGVSAALAQSVQRALNLPGTGSERGQTDGDRLFG